MVVGQADPIGTGIDRMRFLEDSALIRRLADTILTDGQAYGNLRMLTKKVGARLSGSPGYYKAERWGRQALEDAQADKVWMQECMVPHWVRGGKDSAAVGQPPAGISGGPGYHRAWEFGGDGAEGLDAQVMLIHNFDELEQRKDEVKGKIVFYNYPFQPVVCRDLPGLLRTRCDIAAAGASRAANMGRWVSWSGR